MEGIRKRISEGRRFLVTTHVGPDPDAVGSAFGLGIFLEELGKDVVVFLEDLPYFCSFLPRPKGYGRKLEGEFDVAFSLDAENKGRLPEDVLKAFDSSKVKIVIDHHSSTEDFGDIVYKDPGAASTGVMVYRIIKGFGPISKDVALNIYTTIVGDTGSFRYSSTNSEAFIIAAELLGLGVDPWYVSENLFENHPRERLKLLEKALNTLSFTEDGKIGIIVLTYDDLKDFGDQAYYLTDGFVNFVRGIKGVEMAILAKEKNPGEFKLSIRGKGSLDVSQFARMFGGGGHKNAAGCTVKASSKDELIRKVLDEGKRFIGGWLCSCG